MSIISAEMNTIVNSVGYFNGSEKQLAEVAKSKDQVLSQRKQYIGYAFGCISSFLYEVLATIQGHRIVRENVIRTNAESKLCQGGE